MWNPLHWLSGVDHGLLNKCTRLRDSERRRFASFGGLILIPATIGLVAMGYACYTFLPDYRQAIVGGVLWFLIILWVDRFISMTLHKSSLTPPYIFWAGFGIRLVMAGVIGYGLAHPAMLFLFRQEIEQEMRAEARAKREVAFEKATSVKAAAFDNLSRAKADAIRDLTEQLNEKTEMYDCETLLISMEQAKGIAAGTPALDKHGRVCGYASGEEGCKERCQEYKRLANQAHRDINDINHQITARLAVIDGDSGAEIGKTTQTADELQSEVMKEQMPTDYASRTAALASVERQHPEIRAVRTFLVVFLVMLDTLIVSLKAIIPKGEYEELRDSALWDVRVASQAERDAAAAWATYHRGATQSRLTHESQKGEIASLLGAITDVIKEQHVQFKAYDESTRWLRENIRKVRDEETKKFFMQREVEARHACHEAWTKAMEKFRAYIKNL